jgi:hypothetical protein
VVQQRIIEIISQQQTRTLQKSTLLDTIVTVASLFRSFPIQLKTQYLAKIYNMQMPLKETPLL